MTVKLCVSSEFQFLDPKLTVWPWLQDKYCKTCYCELFTKWESGIKVTKIFKCSHFGTEKYVLHIHGLKSNCEQKYKVQKHSHELWVVYESISHDHKRLVNQRTTSSACNRLSGYSITSFQQASIFWRTRFQKVCKNHLQFDIHPILFEGKVLYSSTTFHK